MAVMDEDLEFIVMNIIIDSGSCRSYAMEAIAFAKEGKFEEADKAIDNANEDIQKAHEAQTDLLQKEAGGTELQIGLIVVHSQDHLMNALVVRDMAIELIAIYRKFDSK